ncbi:unnamed protein product [Sphagnum jensenii]|uniref:C2 domain-containing protein n=1 Tax=Sphagnum jensenii TaxID=128206 RepID=A0ABP1BH08_9BRYO
MGIGGSFAAKAIEVLVPSWGEINVSLVAALSVLLLAGYVHQKANMPKEAEEEDHEETKTNPERKGQDILATTPPPLELENDDNDTVKASAAGSTISGESLPEKKSSSFIYLIRLELLAAKNLIAANLNGTSDPYAVITCGAQKRFSSMIAGSRNPMWGEEFDFYSEELPVEIQIAIYDWDIMWKSNLLGSMSLIIDAEEQNGAAWHMLDSTGQVCIQVMSKRYPVSASGSLNGYLGVVARRRLSQDQSKPVGTEVHQKPGPLQTIFNLPLHEVVEHSYSCALERSFLYHGRMYVSALHICFHSNIFAKQLKVILPYEDIEEMKRSQHAVINPAINIILRSGSGGQGVPPLAGVDGRPKYKFASFWNRNHTLRTLERALNNFNNMHDAAKQEHEQPFARQEGTFGSLEQNAVDIKTSTPQNLEEIVVLPSIKDDVLHQICKVELACTAQEYFTLCLADDSKFIEDYCAERKDTDLQVEQWRHVAGKKGGMARMVTYRSLCHSPMCPPDTAVTVWQHVTFSDDKKVLLLEIVNQAHDVPFGSCFEVHARWLLETSSATSCTLVVKVGVHFKRWCVMQSKIRAGTLNEYTADVEMAVKLALRLLTNSRANLQRDENP